MKKRIKSWFIRRWAKFLTNLIIVQEVHVYPKGMICAHCVQIDAMRAAQGSCPLTPAQGDSPQKSGQSPIAPVQSPSQAVTDAATDHIFGCPCPTCQLTIDDRLDRLEGIKEFVFTPFGDLFTWHTQKHGGT